MNARLLRQPIEHGRLASAALAWMAQGLDASATGPEADWLRAGMRPAAGEGPSETWRRWCESPPDADRALHGLCGMLGLGHTEALALALAAEVEVDAMAGRVLAWLQAPIAAARPSMGLVAKLASQVDGAPLARHLAGLSAGMARRCGLLHVNAEGRPLPEATLSVPVPIALALHGHPSDWEGVETGFPAMPPLPQSQVKEAVRFARALGEGMPALALRGGQPIEARMAARAIADALSLVPAFFEGDPAPGFGPWLWLTGHLPVLCLELAPGECRRLPRIPGYPGPLLVGTGPDGCLEREGEPVGQWRLALPDAHERRVLWARATGDPALADALAGRFRQGAARIAALARAGQFEATLGGESLQAAHVLRAGRRGAAVDLGALAEPMVEDIPDQALVLTPSLRVELDMLCQRCLARDRLDEGLGPAMRARFRPGVRALLYGPSGTGKSLAVGWLATRIGLPLYRVDLASVTSKYIGETEKNLAQLFARAEHAEVVLMFDEADALFGKRTEVKDSNDRFANAQTNYLLQRIESFEGIAILASNSRARFDAAFTRRLDAIVEFPQPAPEERRGLWLAHLGQAHDLSPAEVNRLAAVCDLAGGHIRNATLWAASAARAQGRPIAFADLAAGVLAEYRKLGRQAPTALQGCA